MADAGTRHEILACIVDHGGATVAELCAETGLADATIRRHLNKLALDGLLTIREVRQPVGRPSRRYEASDDGVRRERDHSAALAARLLRQLRLGRHEEADVARGLAADLVAEHRAEMRATDPVERIREIVTVLKTEGILDAWEPTDQGYLLRNHACPYRSAADTSDCVCESDRLAIERLLGVPVAQVARLAHGDSACEYFIAVADLAVELGTRATLWGDEEGARAN